MNGLTAVSLFAGIGGFDLALKRAGVRVAAAVEIDAACRGELARHFPETELFNDVTEVTGDQLRAAGFVPGRGVITGGFPCQDLSVAGRRAGLAGSRSGLFWHIMRLADDLRPRWLLLENVPGLLSAVCPCAGDGACVANGRAVRCGEWRAERIPGPADELRGDDCFVCGHPWDFHDAGGFCSPCQDTCDGLPEVRFRKVFIPDVSHGIKGGACPGGCMADHGGAMGTVLGALGERGYGFAYRVLDAQFFGVPQRRERVFIAGCLGDRGTPVQVLLEPEGGDGHHAPRRQARPRVAGTLAASAGGGGLGGVGQSGNAITSRIVESTVSALQGGGHRGHRIDAEGAAGGHLLAVPVQDGRGFEKAQNGIGIGAEGDPSFTLDTTGAQSVIAFPVTVGTLATNAGPRSHDAGNFHCNQAVDAGYVIPVALRGREDGSNIETGEPGEPAFTVRTPGGGSSYPMVATFGGEGVTHALTSEGADASEDGTGRGTPIVAIPMAFNPQTGGSKARLGWGDKPTALQANQITAVAFAENQRGEVVESPVSHQLTTGGGKPGQGYPAVRQAAAVRRLTPRECERLQGFPDDWTRWNADGNEQSDSARYRQLGNAVAVPVVEWITRRIVAADASLAADWSAA